MIDALTDEQRQVVAAIRQFVEKESGRRGARPT